MKLKVLYLANIPAPYAVEYFVELGKMCDLTVIYERTAASDRDIKWTSDARITYSQIFLKGKNIGTENSWCPSVTDYLKTSYDAIIIGTYSSFTAMWAIRYLRRHRIPYIISSDGGFIAEGENFLKRRLKTSLIGNAQAWISSGENTNKYLKYYGAKEENIFIYPFTSLSEKDILSEDVDFETKTAIREELNLKGKNIVVGVGQFIYRKGWDILVKAVKLLNEKNPDHFSDTHYYIIGGTAEDFRKQIAEAGLSVENIPDNIHTVEFADRGTVFKYYRASNISILPTREDIWGLVVNEAMANSIPVITTDRCLAGLELIQNDVNGYLFKSENYCELAEKIEKIFDRDLQEMGRKAIEAISGYTYSVMAEKTVDMVKVLKGNNIPSEEKL